MSNTDLWKRHRTPPDDALKKFKRQGGFEGTAIDPMWMIYEATQEWGPMGGDWGFDLVEESIERFSDEWVLHSCTIELWYGSKGCGRIASKGNTWLVFPTRYGVRYDDEASKKSITDAINKALSWLGFGADVFMGMFDGNKYVNLFNDEPEEDIWTSPEPPEDIPDDILETVQKNYNAIQKKFKNAKDWHTKVLPNFLDVSKEEMKDGVKKAIGSLSPRKLYRLSELQNERLKIEKENE